MSKSTVIKKIDHIGVAVPDLAAAVALYTVILGQGPQHQEDVKSEKVSTAFFDVGGVAIELLQATDADSPIAKFIAKQGRGGVHHICLEVDDIQVKIDELQAQGLVLIDQVPKNGAHGKLVAFLHPKSAAHVLIELSSRGTACRART